MISKIFIYKKIIITNLKKLVLIPSKCYNYGTAMQGEEKREDDKE